MLLKYYAGDVCSSPPVLFVHFPRSSLQSAMVKDSRITYRRRHSYNTKSNRIRVVKTPGTLASLVGSPRDWVAVATAGSCFRLFLVAACCVAGGRLVAQYVTKTAKGPQCGEAGCSSPIQGVRTSASVQPPLLNLPLACFLRHFAIMFSSQCCFV